MKKNICSFKDLVVWQKSHLLAKECIKLLRKINNNQETRIIKEQLIKSATSVPANIAEGYAGKKSSAYQNYLVIARRSCSETKYWLILINDLKIISKKDFLLINNYAKEVYLILSKIIYKLENNKKFD